MNTPRRRRGTRRRSNALPVTATCFLVAVTAAFPAGTSTVSGKIELVGYGSSVKQQPASAAGIARGADGNAAPTFAISGKVSGLYPGKTLPLVLTVSNPNKYGITVRSISTAVGNASSLCVAANVLVTSFTGALFVGPAATGKATVHATMVHSAPNACKGAVFAFHYKGTGTAP